MAPSVREVTFFGWVGGPKYPPPAINNEQRKKSEKVWFRGFLYTSFLPKISAPLKISAPSLKINHIYGMRSGIWRGGGRTNSDQPRKGGKTFWTTCEGGGSKKCWTTRDRETFGVLDPYPMNEISPLTVPQLTTVLFSFISHHFTSPPLATPHSTSHHRSFIEFCHGSIIIY